MNARNTSQDGAAKGFYQGGEAINIIFLDIDGVLNDWERSWRDIPDYNPEILAHCVRNLNKVIRATESQLVLSSSWRNLITAGHMSLFGFEKMLMTHGVRGFLIAHTRVADDEYRWQEIAAWLKEPHQINGQPVKVSRYCILDDDPDAFGGRTGVRTAGGIGLTEADADLAIEILAG